MNHERRRRERFFDMRALIRAEYAATPASKTSRSSDGTASAGPARPAPWLAHRLKDVCTAALASRPDLEASDMHLLDAVPPVELPDRVEVTHHAERLAREKGLFARDRPIAPPGAEPVKHRERNEPDECRDEAAGALVVVMTPRPRTPLPATPTPPSRFASGDRSYHEADCATLPELPATAVADGSTTRAA
jgi:hypothetical protein